MKVDVLAIGSELLYGDIVNGNAAWIGQRLSEIGVDVKHSAVVGDDILDIEKAIRDALSRADALIITGGLGPTQDDLTREGLAAAAGVELIRDTAIEDELIARFERLRRDVPEMNFRQADVPVGAWTIHNIKGTAPGLGMELLGGVVYCLPGVPHEMQPMLVDSVLADLVSRQTDPAVVVHRIIRTAGMWESAVAQAMAPEVERVQSVGNPEIAFLASGGMTRVKITARARTREEALELIGPVEKFAADALGEAIFGYDDDSIEKQVFDLLSKRGETVATAESLTGGSLAARLSEMPGSSAILLGGIVAYSSELKEKLLGVDGMTLRLAGSVTADVATAMAAGARERCGATYALGLTGVAGPEPWDGKPVGTVFVALAHPGGCEVRELRLPGDRERIRDYAGVAALDLLRRTVLAADSTGG